MGKNKDLNKRVRRTQKQIKDDDAKAALALKKNTRPIAMLLQKKQKQQPKQQQHLQKQLQQQLQQQHLCLNHKTVYPKVKNLAWLSYHETK